MTSREAGAICFEIKDGSGVQFTEARPVKWMERKMDCKWFGPFIPPEESCHV